MTTLHLAILAAAVLGATFTCYYLVPWLMRQILMARVKRRAEGQRVLALTYDDGPSGGVTPRLLDLLGSRGARATFFMLGSHAREFPDLVERIAREGHQIACHSDQHLNAWKVSPRRAIADIDHGYAALVRWIPATAMFRPPYGKITAATYLSLWRRGAQAMWWTIDSRDTYATLPLTADIAGRVKRASGGVVLLHDLTREEPRNQYVLELTAALLDIAESESLNVLTLAELCQ